MLGLLQSAQITRLPRRKLNVFTKDTQLTQAISLYGVDKIKANQSTDVVFMPPLSLNWTAGSPHYETQLNFESECIQTMTEAKPNRWSIDCRV